MKSMERPEAVPSRVRSEELRPVARSGAWYRGHTSISSS